MQAALGAEVGSATRQRHTRAVPDKEREQLMAELAAVHRQMLERDAMYAHCEDEIKMRDEQLALTRQELAAAGAHIEDLTRQIEEIKSTRAWRLAEVYWKVRGRAPRR